MVSWLNDLQLIDLHLHLDGSLSLKSVKELAKLQNIDIPSNDEQLMNRLMVSDDCRDLNEYLEKFDFPLALLQTKEGITLAVYNLLEELKEQNLSYAEIRWAPQLHCQKSLSQEDAVVAAIEGLNKSDFKAKLILCCMRGNDNHEQNLETVRLAAKYKDKGVCAVDLAGAEALFKTKTFEEEFRLAKEKGLNITIHAGEADGPESVWKALEFGAKRIGHGVRSIEDEALVGELVRKQIPLEMCPTSNLNTAMFETLKDYPLVKLMEAGVKVTINTDNMSVSNTTIKNEFEKIIETFNLSKEQVEKIIANSKEASFA